MMVHQLCASGRAVADRMRNAHRSELRNQNVGEFLSVCADDIDRLMNLFSASLDARVAETKQGAPMRPKFEAGTVVVDGRVITAETLFKKRAA